MNSTRITTTRNNANKGYVGGTFQRSGLENSLGELATVLGVTSLMICAFFKFDDLFAEISSLVDLIDSESAEI